MRVFKLFLLVTAALVISYFSWSYHTDKLLEDKHERARLVHLCPGGIISVCCLEGLIHAEKT